MNDSTELRCGAMRCVVLPGNGGSLAGWWHGDRALLRETPAQDWAHGDPTSLAGFPLVPFSNRVAGGSFTWAGKTVRLRLNRAGEPHALHGIGWQRAWALTRQTSGSLVMELVHCGDPDWPWPFIARQEIALSQRGLTITLSARNTADEAVPLAIGYHPYFERRGAWLSLSAQKVWHAGGDNLPLRAEVPSGAFDLSDGPDVEDREIDNCYEGAAWPARIGWHGWSDELSVEGSAGLPCAVVYSNSAAGAFCVEPVAHLSNALNMPSASSPMPVAAPGQEITCRIAMTLVNSADYSEAV